MKTNLLFPKAAVIILCSCFFIQNNLNAQSENILYGVTTEGGTDGNGVIFHIDRTTGLQTVDYSWKASGKYPENDLTDGGNGKFYGMTSEGGKNGYGIIFEWDPVTNIFIKKVDFDGTTNGSLPNGSLTLSGGMFYGMTRIGGMYDQGVIFEWNPTTNILIKKIDFNDINDATGHEPRGSLTLSGGKFYGMTGEGGANKMGVIFEWDPTTNIFIKKIDFDGYAKGRNPHGSLTLKGGKFYGMTSGGGANRKGVIFEWNPTDNTYIKRIDLDDINGRSPRGSLTLSGGLFYGICGGGTNGCGVIFQWDPATNTYLKKIDFDDINDANGSNPVGSLILSGGKFYGMTMDGGSGGSFAGVIFEWDPTTNIYTKKINFDGMTKGSDPFGSLALCGRKFFGMTYSGGVNDLGVIFEWDPSENFFTKKIDFDGTAEGRNPYGSLTFWGGKFYAMTNSGGAFENSGVIFEWDPANNTYTKKIIFNDVKGGRPYGSLTLCGEKFYGMNSLWGIYNNPVGQGNIFEWDPASNIYINKIDFDGSQGGIPNGSLTLSSGKFYGMTKMGGGYGLGVIFEWNAADNSFFKKIVFDGSTKGSLPYGSLTNSGGKFYGMTYSGGLNDLGVIFEWDTATNIFYKKIDLDGVAKGSSPEGSLTIYNGKFYGMTAYGGTNDMGVIFEWDPATNIYTKKIDFDGSLKGRNPTGSLALSNGMFYGMTDYGGANDKGVIFEWDPVTNDYNKLLDFDGINGSTPVYSQLSSSAPLNTNSSYTNQQNVVLYPNPSKGLVTVKCSKLYDTRLILSIYNLQGQTVKTVQIEPKTIEIQVNLNDKQNGMYLLELKDSGNGKVLNRSKIVKYE